MKDVDCTVILPEGMYETFEGDYVGKREGWRLPLVLWSVTRQWKVGNASAKRPEEGVD